MPRYRYTGFVERVLHGLQHGVNAVLHRDGHGQPDLSTVVVKAGDELTTAVPYLHAELVLVEEVIDLAKAGIKELREHAKRHKIDLGGAKTKAEVAAVISAATPPPVDAAPAGSVQNPPSADPPPAPETPAEPSAGTTTVPSEGQE